MHRSLTLALSSTLAIVSGVEAREIFVSNEKGNSITVIDGDRLEVTATIPVGNRPRVANILPGAACTDALRLGAMIVKLQRHPDHLGARARRKRRDHARIDSARHGDDDSPTLHRFGELKIGPGEPGGDGNRVDHDRRHLGTNAPKCQLSCAPCQDIDAG